MALLHWGVRPGSLPTQAGYSNEAKAREGEGGGFGDDDSTS